MACGGAPPRDLIDARAALARAEAGPARTYNPAGIHVAKNALADAELSFEIHGNDYRTRDRSYSVIRKIERVETVARTRKFEAETEDLLHRTWMLKMQRYMQMLQQPAPKPSEERTP